MSSERRSRPRTRASVVSVAVVAVLLAGWWLLTPHYISELRFPSPAATLRAIGSLRSALLVHAAATLMRVLLGWAAGCAAGVLIGLTMSKSVTFERAFSPVLEILRPVPPVALVPFFIIWFGVGASGQVFLITLSCFMVLAVTTYVAAQNVPTTYIQTAASLGASPGRIYRTVVVPAALPSIAAGCRVAAALAFGVGVAAEFMGAQSGLGYMVMVARRTLNTDTILVGLVTLGLESYGVDTILRRVIAHLTRWNQTPVSETLAALR